MHKVTLIPGDGIGPEITQAVQGIFAAAGVPVQWEIQQAGHAALWATGSPLPEATLDSIKNNRLALKGPLTTEMGKGHRSINVTLRRSFDLYCNLRPVAKLPGVQSRYQDVDIAIFRENTEDLYAGIEHMAGKNAAESIRLITRDASLRIAEAAFLYAVKQRRKKVTAIHKANIMKLTDGLFLECTREVAAKYPHIKYQEVVVDNVCLQLVHAPEQFDVLVAPNLYGDIISDLCAGLVGGLGVVPGANLGKECAIFETVHGTAPDIAGKNIANPTALLLAAIMLLEHIGDTSNAERIKKAVTTVLAAGSVRTPDLGGVSTTSEFTAAIIANL